MDILTVGGASIQKLTIEGYLRNVEHIFSVVGSTDPQLDHLGHANFRLGRQLRAYYQDNPPPTRIYPIPITLIHE